MLRTGGSDLSPDLVLTTGAAGRGAGQGDVPIVHVQETGPDARPAGGDVTIGLAPPGTGKLAEIVAPPDAPAAPAALSLARRLGRVPVFIAPGRAFLSGRLLGALRRHGRNLGAGGDRLAAAWVSFGGAGFALPHTAPDRSGAGQGADPLLNGLLAVLINEGALALEEGCVADPASIDVVAVTACGFPRWRGGPMHYAEAMGIGVVSEWMEDVMGKWPGSWRMSELLRRSRT